MEDKKHTPLHWQADIINGAIYITGKKQIGLHSVSHLLSKMNDHEDVSREEALANAEFIVRACNSHYELLDALKAVVREYDCAHEVLPAYYQAIEAISKAEGK